MGFLEKALKPLRSRKVRVSLATVLVAVLAEYGLSLSTELVIGILGIGSAVVLGIAHEDNGRHCAQVPGQAIAQGTPQAAGREPQSPPEGDTERPPP